MRDSPVFVGAKAGGRQDGTRSCFGPQAVERQITYGWTSTRRPSRQVWQHKYCLYASVLLPLPLAPVFRSYRMVVLACANARTRPTRALQPDHHALPPRQGVLCEPLHLVYLAGGAQLLEEPQLRAVELAHSLLALRICVCVCVVGVGLHA